MIGVEEPIQVVLGDDSYSRLKELDLMYRLPLHLVFLSDVCQDRISLNPHRAYYIVITK
jgi:hypothetical protein